MTKDEEVLVNRWRLILGRFAESHLPLAEELRETDEALAFLYDREYTAPQRGLRSDATEEEEEEESSDQTGPVFSPFGNRPRARMRIGMKTRRKRVRRRARITARMPRIRQRAQRRGS